eukprot:1155953-Pelagomonas_calceolata.AAC.6
MRLFVLTQRFRPTVADALAKQAKNSGQPWLMCFLSRLSPWTQPLENQSSPAVPPPLFVFAQKFRPAVADALAKQAKSLGTDLTSVTGSQSFTPPDGAVEIAPLSSDEVDVLQTALAGRQSFSSPAVQQPLNRLKGGRSPYPSCAILVKNEKRKAKDKKFECTVGPQQYAKYTRLLPVDEHFNIQCWQENVLRYFWRRAMGV